MASQKSWGISWLGDEKVQIYESSVNVSNGTFIQSSKANSHSKVIHMDVDRYQYELERVEAERKFSEDFSPKRFYRRLDGHNYSHPVEERETFDTQFESARRIAAEASSTTVTPAALLDNQLHEPLLKYLDGDRPRVILHSDHKGIHLGPDKDSPDEKVTPSAGNGCYVVFFDDRMLFVVGKTSRDEVSTVDYDGVRGGELSVGVLKYRLTIEHSDGMFHIWVDRGYETDDLKAAVTAITRVNPVRFTASNTASTLREKWAAAKETQRASEPKPDFDPSEYETDTIWWLGARIAVLLPIALFGALFAGLVVATLVHGSGPDAEMDSNLFLNALAVLFLLSIPVGAILFTVSASKDKAALVAATGHGRKRHPITIGFFLYFSAGLYSLYYLYRRWTKYGS